MIIKITRSPLGEGWYLPLPMYVNAKLKDLQWGHQTLCTACLQGTARYGVICNMLTVPSYPFYGIAAVIVYFPCTVF